MSKSNSTLPESESNVAPEERSDRELLLAKADALYRAATECCRQHRRYAAMVERKALFKEQSRARALVRLVDEQVMETAASYEKTAGRTEGLRAEEWWRRANSLWLAAREYARRHSVARRSPEHLEVQNANTMVELAMDYDLEASALLLMSQAADAYRKVRPEAELCPPKH